MSEHKTLSPLFTWRSAICDAELSAVAKHIGLTLSMHMNERGASCFPSIERLCRESSRSRNTVRQGLAELEGMGWLKVERPKNQHRGMVTNYRAVVPAWALQKVLDEGTEELMSLVDNLTGRGQQEPPSDSGRGQSERGKGSAATPEVVIEDVTDSAAASSTVDDDAVSMVERLRAELADDSQPDLASEEVRRVVAEAKQRVRTARQRQQVS